MTLVSFIFFVLYENGDVTVSIAFTVLSIVTMLKAPLGSLSNQRLIYVQAAVSLERIEAFLAEREVNASDATTQTCPVVLTSDDLALHRATVEWPIFKQSVVSSHGSELPKPFRLDVDIKFPLGKLSLIVGDTGSGKSWVNIGHVAWNKILTQLSNSALLSALLGEMTYLSGTVSLVKQPHQTDEHGLLNTVAYAAQNPWLQNGTIRDAM